MGLAFQLLALLLTSQLAFSDKYHHEEDSIQPRTTNRVEEKSASFWRLSAQSSLFKKLNDKTKLREGQAKNVIFFLGDGMDLPTVAATRMYQKAEEEYLSFEKFPGVGTAKSYCLDSTVADCGCSATAFLAGVKTQNGVIGLNGKVDRQTCPETKEDHVYSIAKWAQDAGKATGLVTTARLTDATAAAVYSHVSDRHWESDADIPGACKGKVDDMALQLVYGETGQNLDVVLGCGSRQFRGRDQKDAEGQPGVREDGRNLVDEWQTRDRGRVSFFVKDRDELVSLPSRTERLLGMFDSDDCRYQVDIDRLKLTEEPSLTEMTEAAIKVLRRNENGFFLFVEAGRIDHAHHDTQAHYALGETAELDRAVRKALELTDAEETLIVVSADHAQDFFYNGYPERGSEIFGITGPISDDDLPWATLSYVVGPGYKNGYNYEGEETETSGGRKDLREQDMTVPDYEFPATVQRRSGPHGGSDVGVWASGPWAKLFVGNYEQSSLPHIMAYAAKIGPFASSSTKILVSGLLLALSFCIQRLL